MGGNIRSEGGKIRDIKTMETLKVKKGVYARKRCAKAAVEG